MAAYRYNRPPQKGYPVTLIARICVHDLTLLLYVHLGSRQVCGFSHFINGPGNRRVTLYTVDPLLVPRVYYIMNTCLYLNV